MNLESQLKSLNERKTRLSADLCRVIAENEGVEEELLAFHSFIKQLRFRDQIAVQDQPLVCKNLNLYEETLVNIGTSLFKSYPPKRKAIEKGFEKQKSFSQEDGEEKDLVRTLNKKIIFAELLLGKLKLTGAPISVNIDPSMTCNYRCKICHHSMSRKNKDQYLPESVIDKLHGLLSRVEVVHIFGGGEPTLAPSLPVLCEKLSSQGVNAEILTNGSTLGKMNLPLSVLHKIGISFDGDNARTFQAIRHGSNFKRILARIRTFKKSYPEMPLYFNVVVNRVNLDELEGIVRLASDVGVSEVLLNRMINLYAHHDELELTKGDIPKIEIIFEKLRTLSKEKNILLNIAIPLEDLPAETNRFCKEELLVMLEEFKVAEGSEVESLQKTIEESRQALLALSNFYSIGSELDMRVNEVAPDFNATLTELESYLSTLEAELKTVGAQELNLPSCFVPWFRANIRADGTVRPCGMLNSRMGCIESSEGFEAVWNSKDYQDLREAHVHAEPGNKRKAEMPTACKSCTFVERKIFIEEVRAYARDLGVEV